MKTKRREYTFMLSYNVIYNIIDHQLEVETDLYNHYKKYIKSIDPTAVFKETGSGFCVSGDRDVSYFLSSKRKLNLGLLFKNMRRYLYRRGFDKSTTEISEFKEE